MSLFTMYVIRSSVSDVAKHNKSIVSDINFEIQSIEDFFCFANPPTDCILSNFCEVNNFQCQKKKKKKKKKKKRTL